MLFPMADNDKVGLHLTGDRLWEDSAALSLEGLLGRQGCRDWFMLDGDTLLFQHPNCPFGKDHAARLAIILRAWKDLVESGEWRVDENGISNDKAWLEEKAQTSEGRKSFALKTLRGLINCRNHSEVSIYQKFRRLGTLLW